MAKISARGDTEQRRWRRLGGHLLVFTAKGRLLEKLACDSTYHAIPPTAGKRWSWDGAEAEAVRRGYEHTTRRR